MSRRRYRFNEETRQMEEVGAEWTDAERRSQTITEELVYGGMKMPDGTDVSSRKKHREYLKATGMAMASDFTETIPRVQKEQQERRQDKREIREIVGRAFYEAKTQRNRR